MQQAMKNLAATLLFLTPALALVPRCLRMDTTSNNVLQHAYMIMSYLKGKSLDEVSRDVSLSEQIQACKKVAESLHGIRNITFTNAGPLVADPNDLDLVKIGRFEEYGEQLPELDEGAQPLLSSWLTLLFSWRADRESENGWQLKFIKELQAILSQMFDLGYFTAYDRLDTTVLSHSDLHGGNILLDQAQDGQWRVTGILDWEDARHVPKVLAAISLEWMWGDEIYADGDLAFLWTGDLDFVPQTNAAGISTRNKQLKQAIDEYMTSIDPTYMDIVYGRGRWIRRIAKYAMFGWHDNRDDTMTEWLIKEWREHRLASTT